MTQPLYDIPDDMILVPKKTWDYAVKCRERIGKCSCFQNSTASCPIHTEIHHVTFQENGKP